MRLKSIVLIFATLFMVDFALYAAENGGHEVSQDRKKSRCHVALSPDRTYTAYLDFMTGMLYVKNNDTGRGEKRLDLSSEIISKYEFMCPTHNGGLEQKVRDYYSVRAMGFNTNSVLDIICAMPYKYGSAEDICNFTHKSVNIEIDKVENTPMGEHIRSQENGVHFIEKRGNDNVLNLHNPCSKGNYDAFRIKDSRSVAPRSRAISPLCRRTQISFSGQGWEYQCNGMEVYNPDDLPWLKKLHKHGTLPEIERHERRSLLRKGLGVVFVGAVTGVTATILGARPKK